MGKEFVERFANCSLGPNCPDGNYATYRNVKKLLGIFVALIAETFRAAAKAMTELKSRITELQERSASGADAARVAELLARIASLEKRQAESEKGLNAHRRHLSNIEEKLKLRG